MRLSSAFHFLVLRWEFILSELVDQIQCEYKPDIWTSKFKLEEKYGHDVIMATSSNKPAIVCSRNIGHKSLNESFYNKKAAIEEEERRRVVEAVGWKLLGRRRRGGHHGAWTFGWSWINTWKFCSVRLFKRAKRPWLTRALNALKKTSRPVINAICKFKDFLFYFSTLLAMQLKCH